MKIIMLKQIRLTSLYVLLIVVGLLDISPISSSNLGVSLPKLSSEDAKNASINPRICPTKCTCDKFTVDCSHQNLAHIPSGIPKDTRILNLADNAIEKVDSNAFAGMRNLRRLHLERNRIDKIQPEAFRGVENLKTLRLNLNKLTEIEGSPFSESPLVSLDLSDNSIKCLTKGSLRTGNTFTSISLDRNPISQFSLDAVDRVNWNYLRIPNLVIDDLKCACPLAKYGLELFSSPENQIIHGSANEILFKKLSTCFHRDNNSSTQSNTDLYSDLVEYEVKNSCFQKNSDVLSFTQCPHERTRQTRSLVHSCKSICDCTKAPSSVKCYASKSLTKTIDHIPQDLPVDLIELDLSDSNLTEIKSGAFSNYPQLKQINLSNNQIKNIENGAFNDLTKLSTLFLNENKLDRISSGTFKNLKNLRLLYLNRNKLSCISKHSFNGLDQLQILHLSDNELKVLPETIFNSMKRLKFLYLMRNPFNCNCQLSWLPERLKAFESFSNLGLSQCSTPLHLRGSNIKDLSSDTLQCSNDEGSKSSDDQFLCDDQERTCPSTCRCQEIYDYDEKTFFLSVDCSNRQLLRIPDNLPLRTSILNLDKNLIESLDELGNLVYLKYVSIANNQIAYVKSKTLAENWRLKTLDLSGNRLTSLPVFLFDKCVNLENLFLHKNNLKCFSSSVLEKNRNLTILTLDSNDIESIEEGSLEHLRLNYLSIDNNRFECNDELRWLPNYLRSIGNVLRYPPICTKPDSLVGIEIDALVGKEFTNSNSISSCSTQFNGSHSLHETCPEMCQCIGTKVHCENRNLTEIPLSLPMRTTELYLDQNSIERIDSEKLANLKNLEVLHLNSNLIEEINEGALEKLEKLKILSFHSNRIKCLHKEAFRGNKNLHSLILQNNRIHTLDQEIFNGMSNLKNIALGENPLHCDCELRWLHKLFRDLQIDNGQPKCSTPDNLSNQFFSKLNSSQFLCTEVSSRELNAFLSGCRACDTTSDISLKNCNGKGVCKPQTMLLYSCECLSGYSGQYCSHLATPCESNKCLNEGVCKNLSSSDFVCECKDGFYGERCEETVDLCQESGIECLNRGVCQKSNSTGYPICTCANGFKGDRCETSMTPCLEYQPCQNNGTCQMKNASYECHCLPGYKGKDCQEEINECHIYGRLFCQNGSTCKDKLNGYECICRPGYYGQYCDKQESSHVDRFQGEKITTLNFIRESLDVEKNSFDLCKLSQCKNYGQCIPYHRGNDIGYTCQCLSGYSGKYCERLDKVHLPSAIHSYLSVKAPEILFYPSGSINFTISLDPSRQSPVDSLLMYYSGAKDDPSSVLSKQFISLEIYQGHLRLLYSANGIDRYQTFTPINSLQSLAGGQAYKSKCDISLFMTSGGGVRLLVDNVAQTSSIQHLGIRRVRRMMLRNGLKNLDEFYNSIPFGKSLIFTGPIYFGSLPTEILEEARRFQKVYSSLGYMGCISNMFFNSDKVNFAQLNGLQGDVDESKALTPAKRTEIYGMAVGIQAGCHRRYFTQNFDYPIRRARHYRQNSFEGTSFDVRTANRLQITKEVPMESDEKKPCSQTDAEMCKNGGQCYQDGFKRNFCQCAPGFTGLFCENEKSLCKREINVNFLRDPETSCMSKRKVRIHTCSGQCQLAENGARTCCQPVEYREKVITFHCADTGILFKKPVKFVRRCSCQTCP